MKVLTIGFTKKTARKFFEILQKSGARRVVDVRLNNVSQLAGFAKRDDLAYFLESICGMQYIHLPELAPTQDMLDDYKKNGGDWDTYEKRFLDLMEKRRIESTIPGQFANIDLVRPVQSMSNIAVRDMSANGEWLALGLTNMAADGNTLRWFGFPVIPTTSTATLIAMMLALIGLTALFRRRSAHKNTQGTTR